MRNEPTPVAQARCRHRSGMGFTLIELLVTVVIAGILLAIAIPAFRLPTTAAEANTLLGTLQYAQSSAIRLGQLVVVCPTANPNSTTTPTCSSGSSWSTGWIVLLPRGETTGCAATGTATISGVNDQVLQVGQPLKGTDSATYSTTAANAALATPPTSFCFYPQGFSPTSSSGSVEFTTTPNINSAKRCTVVAGVGHMQVLQYQQWDYTQTFQCL